jgi:hypothetical protein
VAKRKKLGKGRLAMVPVASIRSLFDGDERTAIRAELVGEFEECMRSGAYLKMTPEQIFKAFPFLGDDERMRGDLVWHLIGKDSLPEVDHREPFGWTLWRLKDFSTGSVWTRPISEFFDPALA